jgi:hypothetical protein
MKKEKEKIINIYFKHHRMQIHMDSDIVYFVDDNNLSKSKYKARDYIPGDELYELFHNYMAEFILPAVIFIFLS